MTSGATFLTGASGRLLPFWIPFRFFGAAVAFHLVAWLAALAGAETLPSFGGGLGWPLAALHAVTLGVLAMTAIGASLQLFPVATRRPIAHARLIGAVFWTYVPGVAAIVVGMGWPSTALLGAGALAVAVALAGFVALFALNLSGGRGMPLVVAHGAVAAGSLAATLVIALGLVGAYAADFGFRVDRTMLVPLHVALAGYGFMGMLALGLSYVLVPMFAIADAPPAHRGWASFALATGALVLGVVASLGVLPGVLGVAAAGLGAVAAILHVQLMREAIAGGLRRELGTGFRLIRHAWIALVASLVLALGLALEWPWPRLATLFGATLIAGWLLSFVLGVLQRIVPFLALMHAARGRRRPPTPSSLTDERSLRAHLLLHLAALGLLALAIVVDSDMLARAACVAGAAGACVYAVFFVRAVGAARAASGANGAPQAAP